MPDYKTCFNTAHTRGKYPLGSLQKMKHPITKMVTALAATALTPLTAYAFVLRPDANPSDFDALTLTDAPGYIMGIAFWVVRIIGLILIIAGIYSYAMAKKDGDADEITVGLVKTCIGALFLSLPYILKALGIIVF